jgi:hypothetical protein
MVQKTSSGSSLRHSSCQCTLPLQENKKEHVSIIKSMENIVKGLLNHENVEENSSERRT